MYRNWADIDLMPAASGPFSPVQEQNAAYHACVWILTRRGQAGYMIDRPTLQITWLEANQIMRSQWMRFNLHSGETDEANCSWLHPVWPPPKRPDQDSTFCVVSRASTDLIFCTHRDFDVRNNVYKPRRLVCGCCRDISVWKSRVMKPTVLGDEANFGDAFAWDEANWVWMKPTPHLRRVAYCHTIFGYTIITILPLKRPPLVVLWKAMVL